MMHLIKNVRLQRRILGILCAELFTPLKLLIGNTNCSFVLFPCSVCSVKEKKIALKHWALFVT